MTDRKEAARATFDRWLSDGTSWIGVFENHDLGHPDIGRRVARVFDIGDLPLAKIGSTRAPDHDEIGLGWRYILVAACDTTDKAMDAMKWEEES